jgi:hypothetical protein
MTRGGARPHHHVCGVWSAEQVDGLVKPCLPLLGQAAWFVFGFPGFQGGLLGQLQRLHRSGWAAVGLLEIGCEYPPPGFDAGSTRRPPGIQAGVDADDFSDRSFPRVLVRPFGESQAEIGAEVVL